MVTPEQLNKVFIKQSAELETTPLKVINQIGQETWVIVNIADEKEINLHFSDMNERERLWAQQNILQDFPFQDARNTLRYAHSTLKVRLTACKKLLSYLREKPDEKQQFKNWTINDCVKIIQTEAVKQEPLTSCGAIRPLVLALTGSYKLRYEQDGIPVPLPSTFIQQVMTPLCKQVGITYSQWERGGSHGMVPMPVATLLLADAINLIRSRKCRLLQCYFSAYKEGLLSTPLISGASKASKSIFNNDLKEFLEPSLFNRNRPNHLYDKKRVDFVTRLREVEPNLSELPFRSQTQINEFVWEVEGACLTILLAVTAMRLSECHSVGADWMESIEYLDVNGVWTVDAILKSKIIKTGGGIIAKRGLSPIGVEVFELLNALSWIDKEKYGAKLFSTTYKSGWHNGKNSDIESSSIALKTLRKRLQSYYQQFVERAHRSVKEAFPDIVPHNLRHLKMAFALRKFDGNIEEGIKQEFRHHGHHTQSYSRNKLNEEEAAIVRREYTQDIIKRILINDPNDKWVGPSAKKIRALATKLLHGQNIEMLSLEELAEFHQEMDENIHSMLMHSYGMCFVLKDSVHLAKCGVKDSIVKTGSANSKLCHACTNFCVNNKSHQHDLSLNKRRWTATANSELIASFPIVAEAKAMVKNIEKLEAALEADDE